MRRGTKFVLYMSRGHHKPGSEPVQRVGSLGTYWKNLKRQMRCGLNVNHCYHLLNLPYDFYRTWFCCVCDRETISRPPDECIICTANRVLNS